MFKHPPAQHAVDNVPGQLVNDVVPQRPFLPQTLKQEINRIMKDEDTSGLQKQYDKGFAEGYMEGKRQGFQDALNMIGGMT
jgi:flagellar biosynthesis/type III secretory pathway protein FliH